MLNKFIFNCSSSSQEQLTRCSFVLQRSLVLVLRYFDLISLPESSRRFILQVVIPHCMELCSKSLSCGVESLVTNFFLICSNTCFRFLFWTRYRECLVTVTTRLSKRTSILQQGMTLSMLVRCLPLLLCCVILVCSVLQLLSKEQLFSAPNATSTVLVALLELVTSLLPYCSSANLLKVSTGIACLNL